MQSAALKILLKLEEYGELTLAEISTFIPIKFGDHRDFYVLASLASVGYIDDDTLPSPDCQSNTEKKEALLAREYFACHDAEESATSGDSSWRAVGASLKGKTFMLTAKGSLYLSEYRSKRNDRLFTVATGVAVGIIVAVVSAYVRTKL